MTEKRFTNIEHDYENAWIKCNDDGYFMIYAIYKELDEGLPSLEDLLNGLAEENEQLKKENKELKKENEQLKSDNFNLNKSVECLDETVKKQCNKIDWADECDVRWEEEYNKWIGRKE